ncbi:hypothetical protein L228DRAFT_100707 [Xylona heveae TC161]|uniref:Uncharacterized protein n=1 Tax=Xylona heveae (strain CBS 132557 / TC161) TaxID=1328760 RepID=A0A161TF68_XYLHT|nr:hypothetical protein L228DRAFT_100707 [Xylona heveae TC161]KZF24637.1 hypothetical protein L228DRAFT_100707 [Xylona heveae TC161]
MLQFRENNGITGKGVNLLENTPREVLEKKQNCSCSNSLVRGVKKEEKKELSTCCKIDGNSKKEEEITIIKSFVNGTPKKREIFGISQNHSRKKKGQNNTPGHKVVRLKRMLKMNIMTHSLTYPLWTKVDVAVRRSVRPADNLAHFQVRLVQQAAVMVGVGVAGEVVVVVVAGAEAAAAVVVLDVRHIAELRFDNPQRTCCGPAEAEGRWKLRLRQ